MELLGKRIWRVGEEDKSKDERWVVFQGKWRVVLKISGLSMVCTVYAGQQPTCVMEEPTVSSGTNSDSHRLEAQLGANKTMQIRRIVGHPSGLASRPP
eukprot:scaffold111662_cov18-Tisochrysis_lutea.AAC.1